jgi:hypothetical protein
MKRASATVADHIVSNFDSSTNVLVVCGPGNNGGDGYVVAKLLQQQGFAVEVCSTVPIDQLSGDAARARDFWGGDVDSGDPISNISQPLVIDAIFGSGLRGAVTGKAKRWIEAIVVADVKTATSFRLTFHPGSMAIPVVGKEPWFMPTLPLLSFGNVQPTYFCRDASFAATFPLPTLALSNRS